MNHPPAVPDPLVCRRRVLVTGAGGFLGANVVWALHEHGFPVRALVRRPPRGPQWHGLDDVEFVHGDVRDPAAVARAMNGVGYVVHSAALTTLVPRPRREAYRVNVEGTRTVCAAALRASVRRLVFTSSIATVARGTAAAPATEQTPYNLEGIRSPYYASKRLAERVVGDYTARGLDTVTLCPALLLGPRDVRPTTNQLLLYAARAPVPVLPPGGINVIDVREAALAHVRALWLGQTGRRFLLAGPYLAYVHLGDLVKRVTGATGRPRVLARWAYLPGSVLLALATGVLPWLPNGLSLPNFQYGFVPFHVSGARADQAFQLAHRPPAETVFDTLRWFQETGQAPWLRRRLLPPSDLGL
jgi:dihydroflavonol-4-reductase